VSLRDKRSRRKINYS